MVALMTTGFGSGMTRSGSSSSSSSSSSSVTYCSFRIRASSESPSPLVRLPSNPFHDEVLEADPASMPAPLGGLSSAIHLASSSFGSGRVGADLLSRCDSTPTASAATLHANQCSGWSSDKSLALSTACSRTRGKTSRRRTLTRLRRRRAMMPPATSPCAQIPQDRHRFERTHLEKIRLSSSPLASSRNAPRAHSGEAPHTRRRARGRSVSPPQYPIPGDPDPRLDYAARCGGARGRATRIRRSANPRRHRMPGRRWTWASPCAAWRAAASATSRWPSPDACTTSRTGRRGMPSRDGPRSSPDAGSGSRRRRRGSERARTRPGLPRSRTRRRPRIRPSDDSPRRFPAPIPRRRRPRHRRRVPRSPTTTTARATSSSPARTAGEISARQPTSSPRTSRGDGATPCDGLSASGGFPGAGSSARPMCP